MNKNKRRKIYEIVIAVLGALCLWLYVVTVVTPDDTIVIEDIPIVFEGESQLRSENNLIVTNRSTRTVSAKFHGSRVLLKQLQQGKDNITAVVDVSVFTSERDYSSSVDFNYPSSLKELQVMEYTPRTVQFTVEKMATKQVSVKGVFDGTLAEGYIQGELEFDQTKLKVSGPTDLVERVQYAQVILGGDELSATTTKDVVVTLVDMDGQPIRSEDLILSATEVQVTLPIYVEKELTLTVTPVYGGGANEENTAIVIEPASVTVLGDAAELAGMTEISLGELDLALVAEESTVPMEIILPEGMSVKSGGKTAAVAVSFDGLEILPLTVRDIRLTDTRTGLVAATSTHSVSVTLRGPSEDLIELDDTQVYVELDLRDYREEGTYAVPAVVVTGSETVAAVGEYAISVNMRER